MATKFGLSVLFISFCSSFSPTLSSSITSNEIESWCNKTPYPGPCKYSMKQNQKTFIPNQEFESRRVAIELALQSALTAQSHHQRLWPTLRNDKEKNAWTNCLNFYNKTIDELNLALDSDIKSTSFDTQTWLSAASTYLESCRDTINDLGVSDSMLPLMMSNNVSKLITNSLDLYSKPSSVFPQTYQDDFPTWVKEADRKLLQEPSPSPDLVVAQDGSGDYSTIKDALDQAAAKSSGNGRFVIYIKSGVYKEYLEIGQKLENIMLVGDGMTKTIITGSRRNGTGAVDTFHSATVGVDGGGFIARDITFQNTAGPQNHQAVALRSSSDHSVYYRCGFEGYQDTLYVHSKRQFYRECSIYGTIDFIFGDAAAVLQNCKIYVRRPMDGQKNVITAQGRSSPYSNTGIVIHNSQVLAAEDLGSSKTYLGRPWRNYSRTVFLSTYLDSLVDPAGWLEWDGNFALNTLYYGEYSNTGPGASTSGRVKWPGYKVITSVEEASAFTVANFIGGHSWLPATGVQFSAGL
ncbi:PECTINESTERASE [Salix viminalis]|uniref:Pectinesterase n=1 Tax=Salix viminalis TaxID=40686 RepID=A0A9Q0NUP5_SALVM|nr:PECTINESTERASE [Salix viminalis]